MIYWPENCRGGMGEFWEANRFKVDWAWSGLWQRRMKMVLLGRFALEAEYFSSMAEVLKVAVDWIESLEIECGWSPFWGRPEATAGWRGRGASPTMHFLGPFCSPRKSPSGRTSPTCPQCFPVVGTLNSPRVKYQGSPEVQTDERVVMYRENLCGVWTVGSQHWDSTLIQSLRCSKFQFSYLYNGLNKNT